MNTPSKFIVLIFLLSSFLTEASSTQEQFKITHPTFAEPLIFNISLPSGYSKNSTKSYPLMLNFHSYSNTYLSGMHDWMSHNGEWPWLQTVIITPAKGNRVAMLFDATGKTTPLLDFFENRLLPEVAKNYRINDYKIMSGFRVDGTLVLSALINKPDMFNAYIAISPELKNDYAGVLSKAKNKLAKLDDKPRFLLFSHGNNIKEEHQMGSYEQLHSILKEHAPFNLDWHYKYFSDHYFMSLPLLSVIVGIEKMFDDIHQGLAPESEISQQGIAAIIKHYKFLSEQKYGFDVSPKNSINALGFHLLKTSQPDGLKIFKEMVQRYPEDAYSHHNLAKAYVALNDLEKAIIHQKNAAQLADKMLTWHKKRHRRFLAEYTAKYTNSFQQ